MSSTLTLPGDDRPLTDPLEIEDCIGHEIDLTATWEFSPRTAILFGYSHFFSGDYYKETPGVPHRGDADFFYTQFTVNF